MEFKTKNFPALVASGLLFDMDGTLLDSTAPMLRVWTRWCQRRGIDPAGFLPTIHGRRASESIGALNLPGLDAREEAKWIEDEEVEDVAGVVALPGAQAFLDAIPAGQWALVTSAPRRLAAARLQAAGFAMPAKMVCGEDVREGKPHPACFLLGAERLGLKAQDCIAFEDAPAGIKAAETAGAAVIVVTATHHAPLDTSHRHISSYEGLVLEPDISPRFVLRAR